MRSGRPARWASAVALLFIGPWLAGCRTQTFELSAQTAPQVVLVEDTPADTVALFESVSADEVEQDAKKIKLLYPNHEVAIPSNLAPLEVLWKSNKELDRFEVRISNDHAAMRFYTTATSLRLSDAHWTRLRGQGPATLRIQLRGLSAEDPTTLFESPAAEVHIKRTSLPGNVYFWSTTAQGIMRGRVDSTVAEKFYPPPGEEEPACVGCHTLSRDGQRLAMAGDDGGLRQLSVRDRAVLSTGEAEQRPGYGWGSFDPGAGRLIVAHEGRLTLWDADRSRLLAEVELGPGLHATHPDWAPDGRHIAVTLIDEDETDGKWDDNKKVEGSSIARIPVNLDGTLGAVEVLVQNEDPRDTLVFPAYSPDSRYIAFARSEGKSKDAKKSELWLVRADGTGGLIPLDKLNRRVGAKDDGKDMGNNMPTWAPGLEAGSYWLAFSSARDYGDQPPESKRDQLWAAALDAEAIDSGEDPSAAAFRLPFQQLEDSNHRAFWVLSEPSACATSVEICDSRDNDCDDEVDEGCCVPQPEVCGDGVDNDCDGQRDEACGCEQVEVCGNTVDEDCDMQLDEDCLI